MKIGIALGYYKRFGDDKYKKIKGFGFDAGDYPMADTEDFIYSASFKEAEQYLLRQKELAYESGIVINQVHGPWRWPPKDDTLEDRAERMEKMKRSLEMTAILGCKNWVIHPLEPFGINDIETGNEQNTLEINLEFFEELLPYAKNCGITICLENMPWKNFSIASPEDVHQFVNIINDNSFMVCLDTGHIAAIGGSAGEAVRLFGDKLRALHVHDSRMGADLHLFPYFGYLDFEDFGAALKETGFGGVLSLETAPSSKLPDNIFEEMSHSLYKIGKNIIK